MKFRTASLAVCLIVTGCAEARTRPAAAVAPVDWRAVVTRADLQRLHDWRDAFVKGLDAARAGGFADVVAREGALLDPDAAVDGVGIPSGRYRCRVVKLGAQTAGGVPYADGRAFDCRITNEGEAQSLAKMTGMQRPVGLLFAGDPRRLIFLGTMMLGDEGRAIQYGQDGDRDMAGALERIGPSRWRLVLPYPRFESLTDVVELVPAS